MITYHRGILYDETSHIDDVYVTFTGKYSEEYQTIHVLIKGKKSSIKVFSSGMFTYLKSILTEGEEQLIRVTKGGLEVLDVYVWWFPNGFIEPKRVFTYITKDNTRELNDGTQINFYYDSREKAIEKSISHCEERMEFYKERLEYVSSIAANDAVQPATV